MRRAIGGVPRRPIGQFAGNAPDPTDPTGAIVRDLQDSMTGDPGIRLASSRGRRAFRGGGLDLQKFPLGVTSPASDEALSDLPVKAGTRSRALGQFRGTPAMSWPTEGLDS
jgi:hypothetical protein